jgi:hypothetical protein
VDLVLRLRLDHLGQQRTTPDDGEGRPDEEASLADVRGDGDRVAALARADEGVDLRKEEAVPQRDERGEGRLPRAPPERPDVDSVPALDRLEQLPLARPEAEAEEVGIVAGLDEADPHGVLLDV